MVQALRRAHRADDGDEPSVHAFDEVPEVAAWSAEEAGHKLPLLRDVDSSYYLRQEKNGFNLGPYERNCKAHWAAGSDPMPEDFSFQLYPDDLERLWYIEDAMERVPLLGRRGCQDINGPIPYTPDGNPLIGPMPGVPNAFEACVFTFGIARAAARARCWPNGSPEGETEWDMWSCDPRRFTATPITTTASPRGWRSTATNTACISRGTRWPAGADKKLSPVHDRVEALGGQFGAYNGWERANWFAKPGDDTSEEATQTWNARARGSRGPRGMRGGARRRRHARPAGFLAVRVEGPGARDWLWA
jgi:dimethylglycine dehydrogenase